MLKFVVGDMLQAKTEALVNTVNTVGVMGKGIALQFKEAFPKNYKAYIDACKRKELSPGTLLPVLDGNLLSGGRLIINFPTKTHWRQPSKYEYIQAGLEALKELIKKQRIKSIALPPLGCGNGGLDWSIVKKMISDTLGELEVDIYVYEPNEHIKAALQKEDSKKKDVKLTSARAQLLYSLYGFESLGEFSSLFAANKLAYFLQRMGEPLRLQFNPHHYGPYAIGVEKVLYFLNGIYLKGLEQGEAKPFEPLDLNYQKWEEVDLFIKSELSPQAKTRIQNLFILISNFCSELSLEILATTDFIMHRNPNYSLEEVMSSIRKWSSRKSELFKKEHVSAAYAHLKKHQSFFQA